MLYSMFSARPLGRIVAGPAVWAAVITGVITLVGHPRAQGAIVGINTPGTSYAAINFDDTNSNGPPLGITNTGPSTSPWNGALISLALTTDPNTTDQAQGDLTATFIPFTNTYGISFSNILLTQPLSTTTGLALLSFSFNVQYQLDAAGLPAQATLFPTFFLNGTVQTPPGSFAAFSGSLDYYGVDISGAFNLQDSVSYFGFWTTPGPFSATVAGTPTVGTTPLLMPNTVFEIQGSFKFQVDPATIGGYSLMVPEPGTWALALAGAALILATRKSPPR